ncbi:MAG: hypothetical protein IKW39_01930 [Alphaproteobacteria bacterium]|nr:hypothetical protein [Alphaproteobacteria bacterium]
MNLNIADSRQRQVRCKRVEKASYYFPNADKLVEGQVYNVHFIEMGAWETWVYLKEFPQLSFNSVHFSEMEGYVKPKKGEVPQGSSRKEMLQDYLRIIGRTPTVVYMASILPPTLICSGVAEVNLGDYKERLASLTEDDVFIIGRPNRDFSIQQDVEISKYGGIISRVQAYILKANGMYAIFDPSVNGNKIAF